ncbi:hypothetical protein [Pedomonas mirosovicensis]|uniref:hypothetical protein n=1 Tax=Pedomonas mirosovicensis TaxID=2908641 RepID=UPI00216A8447|nr:hypothetical protein [Pedomonas mirosovicensis]MCH8685982.1 hypothetical protein [Pedomonas mirosovicensis]
MSENARGKGRKRALGAIGSRQIPSVVQPSGVNIDELADMENLPLEEPLLQMGQEETAPEEEGGRQQTSRPQRRRQRA